VEVPREREDELLGNDKRCRYVSQSLRCNRYCVHAALVCVLATYLCAHTTPTRFHFTTFPGLCSDRACAGRSILYVYVRVFCPDIARIAESYQYTAKPTDLQPRTLSAMQHNDHIVAHRVAQILCRIKGRVKHGLPKREWVRESQITNSSGLRRNEKLILVSRCVSLTICAA